MDKKEITSRLQQEAIDFLHTKKLIVKGVEIYPKEIEMYYYKEGEYEDYPVHQADKQQDKKFKFYLHEVGRGGLDLVLSDEVGVYKSLLLRSVVIGDELITGPLNTLDAILKKTELSEEELGNIDVEVRDYDRSSFDVFTSSRIGIRDAKKNEDKYFKGVELRFILCDEFFKQRSKKKVGYKDKEEVIRNYLTKKIKSGQMSYDEAVEYSRKWLGYKVGKLTD